MEEKNKRGWIKNVIIIFLIIMLLLTLFSNTIMNRSLPEVAVQYAESGTITTQVKLSGTVSANQTREITFENARKIDSVLVRRGDYVERGTVLATLIAGESDEIYDAEIELKRLEIEYKQLLLESEDTLIATRYELEDKQKELVELQAYIDGYGDLETVKNNYQAQIEMLQAEIKQLDETIKSLDKQLSKLTDSGYKDMSKLNAAIEEAKDAVDDAEKAYNSAKRAMQKTQTVYNNASTVYAGAEQDYDSAVDARKNIESDIDKLESQLEDLKDELQAIQDSLDSLVPPGEGATPEQIEEYNRKKAELTDQKNEKNAEIREKNNQISSKQSSLKNAREAETAALESFNSAGTAMNSAYSNYTSAKSASDSAESAYKAAKKHLSDLNDGWEYALLFSRKEEVEEEKQQKNEQIEELQKQMDKVAEKLPKTLEDAEDEKVQLTRSIESLEATIRRTEANEDINGQTEALNLEIKRTEINRKKTEIAKLKEKTTSTEITAVVSGTISSVNIASGDEVKAGQTAFEIIMNDQGYTMECSVTNAQASRLSVGQEAEVQYYYWGTKPSVRISAIKNDPNNSGKSKLVTFTVEGDISDGTNLTITVGSRGSSYDTVVPNSAIREDSEGKFVLLVVSKSSPLDNRFFAERKNVKVLASDATKSAIDASLSWGDYIITNSSVPISDGMQVRMSE